MVAAAGVAVAAADFVYNSDVRILMIDSIGGMYVEGISLAFKLTRCLRYVPII